MPLSVGQFIPTTPGAIPQPPPPPPAQTDADVGYDTINPVLTTQRGYRFTGYELAHDSDENVLFFMKNQAWLTQPRIWSQRATSVGYFDLRSP